MQFSKLRFYGFDLSRNANAHLICCRFRDHLKTNIYFHKFTQNISWILSVTKNYHKETWEFVTWQPSTFVFWNNPICVLTFLWGYAFPIDLAEPQLQDNSVFLDSCFQNITMKTLFKTQTRTPGIHVFRKKLWAKASYTNINQSSKVDAPSRKLDNRQKTAENESNSNRTDAADKERKQKRI